MTKLDSIPPSLTSFSPALSRHEPARRLIVLVPDLESDYIRAIRRIWELANTQDANVQFLGLCKDTRQELSLRRVLATMSMMVQDGKVSTEAKVAIGTSWVDIVKRNYQTGDIIVCFAKQRDGPLHQLLNQILKVNLDAPVYILSGFYTREYRGLSWFSQALAWIGSIGVIGGFFLLQSQIGLLPNDWTQTTLLILGVIFEFWLILVWNNLFD
jgi:hypothetical protein